MTGVLNLIAAQQPAPIGVWAVDQVPASAAPGRRSIAGAMIAFACITKALADPPIAAPQKVDWKLSQLEEEMCAAIATEENAWIDASDEEEDGPYTIKARAATDAVEKIIADIEGETALSLCGALVKVRALATAWWETSSLRTRSGFVIVFEPHLRR